MRLRISYLCLFLILVMSACEEKSDALSCESLVSKTTYKNINTSIELSAPPHINSFKFDDPVEIVVDNNSLSTIEVAPDQNLRVFWWKENSWNEVKNGMDYLSRVDRISPETSEDPGIGVYAVLLTISKPEDPVRLCITLEGVSNPEGTQTGVAAFMELEINP